MLRELRAAILPTQGLTKTIANWDEIAKRLAESKRARIRQNP
jgi:hypothetical protein